MATRVNMMKLLQQARGMAEMTGRKPQPRPPGPVLWQMRAPKWKSAAPKHKRIIRINMRDLPDIPTPVAILHVETPQSQATLGLQSGE